MHVLNAGKSAEYFDAHKNEREDSAVRVIHWAWLEHSTALGRLERLEPGSPLDMLVLYQATAATFRDVPPDISQQEELSRDGRVVNWEQAKQRIESVPERNVGALATRFANRVITLSRSSPTEQDLGYCVELFLRCIQDKHILGNILNGSISRESRQLTDTNLW